MLYFTFYLYSFKNENASNMHRTLSYLRMTVAICWLLAAGRWFSVAQCGYQPPHNITKHNTLQAIFAFRNTNVSGRALLPQ
jgi:hypothetical protein